MKTLVTLMLAIGLAVSLNVNPAIARVNGLARTVEYLQEASRVWAIPMPVYRAVIKKENTSWDPNAVGYNSSDRDPNKADHGLMQVNARTARGYGIKDYRELYKVDLNIDLASAHLSGCREQAKKRHAKVSEQKHRQYLVWRDAFACYNAGPTRLARGYAYADVVMKNLTMELMEQLQ